MSSDAYNEGNMNIFITLYAYYTALLRRRWNRKKIERHQKKRLAFIWKYAKKNSPYYAKLYAGKKAFSELPILSKEAMMNHFSLFNTVGISKEFAFDLALKKEQKRSFDSNYGNISIGLSSGTSGNRGLFLVSEKERSLWAGNILAKILSTSLFKKTSIGLFLRANNRLYETLKSKTVSFIYFDLQKPFQELLQELEKNKPDILVAPPSVLRILAEHNLRYVPKKIICCAETLDSIDEKYISLYFKKQIHQIYQCTEGFLGITCEKGSLHINEDVIFLEKEYIDKSSGRFIPIITDLYRTTQPIIRYRLNDVLIEQKTACPCGSHYLALKKVEGRCDDVLYFRKKNGQLEPMFPDFIRRQIISFDESIKEYQIIQKSPDKLDLYINPCTKAMSEHLHKYFIKQGFLPPVINLIDSMLQRKQQNKLRRIIRDFYV